MIIYEVLCLLLITILVNGSKHIESIYKQPASSGYMYVVHNTDADYGDYGNADEEYYNDDSEYDDTSFLNYENTDKYRPAFTESIVEALPRSLNVHENSREDRKHHNEHKYHKKHKNQGLDELDTSNNEQYSQIVVEDISPNRKHHKHHGEHKNRNSDLSYSLNTDIPSEDRIRYTAQSYRNGHLQLARPFVVQNLHSGQQIVRNAYVEKNVDESGDNLQDSQTTQQVQENLYLQDSPEYTDVYVQNSPIEQQIVRNKYDNTQNNKNEGNEYVLSSATIVTNENVNLADNGNDYLQNSPIKEQIFRKKYEDTQNKKNEYLLSTATIESDENVNLQNDRHVYLQNSPKIQQHYIDGNDYLQYTRYPHETENKIYLQTSSIIPNINSATYSQNLQIPLQIEPNIDFKDSEFSKLINRDINVQNSQIPQLVDTNIYLQKLLNNQQIEQPVVYLQNPPNKHIIDQQQIYLQRPQTPQKIEKVAYFKQTPNLQQTNIGTTTFHQNSQIPHQNSRAPYLQNILNQYSQIKPKFDFNSNIRIPFVSQRHRPYIASDRIQFGTTPSKNIQSFQNGKLNIDSPPWYRPIHNNEYQHLKSQLNLPISEGSKCPCDRFIFDRRIGQSSCYCPNIKYVPRESVVMVCSGQNNKCIPKLFCNNGVIDITQYAQFKDTISSDSCDTLTHTCCKVMPLLQKPGNNDQIYNHVQNSNITNLNNGIIRYLLAGNTFNSKNRKLELGNKRNGYEKSLFKNILIPFISNLYNRPLNDAIYTNMQFGPNTQGYVDMQLSSNLLNLTKNNIHFGNQSPHLKFALTADHNNNISNRLVVGGNTNIDLNSFTTPDRHDISTDTTESVTNTPQYSSFTGGSSYSGNKYPGTSGFESHNHSFIGTDLGALLNVLIGANGQVLNLAGSSQASHDKISLNMNQSGGVTEPHIQSSGLKIDINGLTGMNRPALQAMESTTTEIDRSGGESEIGFAPDTQLPETSSLVIGALDSLETNQDDLTNSRINPEQLNIYGLESEMKYGIDVTPLQSSIKDFTGTKVDVSRISDLESGIGLVIDAHSPQGSNSKITSISELGLGSTTVTNIKQPSSNLDKLQTVSIVEEIDTNSAEDSFEFRQMDETAQPANSGIKILSITNTANSESPSNKNPNQSTISSSNLDLEPSTGISESGISNIKKVTVTQFEQSREPNISLEGLRFSSPGTSNTQQSSIFGFGQTSQPSGLTSTEFGRPNMASTQQLGSTNNFAGNPGEIIITTIEDTSAKMGPSLGVTIDGKRSDNFGFEKPAGFINGLSQTPGNFNSSQTITRTVTSKQSSSNIEPTYVVTSGGPISDEYNLGQSSVSSFMHGVPQITRKPGQTITKTIVTTSGTGQISGDNGNNFDQFHTSGFVNGLPKISDNSGHTVTKTVVTTSETEQGSGNSGSSFDQYGTSGFANGVPQVSDTSGQTVTKTVVTTSETGQNSGNSGSSFDQYSTSGFVNGIPQVSDTSGQTVTKTVVTTSGTGQSSGNSGSSFDQYSTSGFVNGVPQVSDTSGQTVTKTVVTTSGTGQSSGNSGNSFDQYSTSGFVNGLPQLSDNSGHTVTKTIVTTTGTRQGSGHSGTSFDQFGSSGFINGLPQISDNSDHTVTKTMITTSGTGESSGHGGTGFDQFSSSGFINGLPQISDNSDHTVTKTMITTSGTGENSGHSGTGFDQFSTSGFINGMPQISDSSGQTITKTTVTTSGSGQGFGQTGTNFDKFSTSGFLNGIPLMSSNAGQTVTKTTVTTSGSDQGSGQTGNSFDQFGISGLFGQSGNIGSKHLISKSSGNAGPRIIIPDTSDDYLLQTNGVRNSIKQLGSIGFGQTDGSTNGMSQSGKAVTKTIVTTFGSNDGRENSHNDLIQSRLPGLVMTNEPSENLNSGKTITKTVVTTFGANGVEKKSRSGSENFGLESSMINSKNGQIQPTGQSIMNTTVETTEEVMETPMKDFLDGIPIEQSMVAESSSSLPVDDFDISEFLSNISATVSNIRNVTRSNATTSDIMAYSTDDAVSTSGSNINENDSVLSEIVEEPVLTEGDMIRKTMLNAFQNPDNFITNMNSPTSVERQKRTLHTGSNIDVPTIISQSSDNSKESRTFNFFEQVLQRISKASIQNDNNFVAPMRHHHSNGIISEHDHHLSSHNQEVFLPITEQTLVPLTEELKDIRPIKKQEVIQHEPDRLTLQASEERKDIQPVQKKEAIQATKIVKDCPVGMQCVQARFCNAAGFITTSPVKLTQEQIDQYLTCGDESIGVLGKCCYNSLSS